MEEVRGWTRTLLLAAGAAGGAYLMKRTPVLGAAVGVLGTAFLIHLIKKS